MPHSNRDAPVGSIHTRLLSLLATLLAVFGLAASDALWSIDHWIYDRLVAIFQHEPSQDIVIVAIDESSLDELGRWPWPRRTHARLIENLSEAGSKGIILDALLAEPDRNDPEGDRLLADAMRSHGRVVLPIIAEPERVGAPLIEVLPMPILTEAARGLGHAALPHDRDGLVRGVFLRSGLGEPHWSILPLALLEDGVRRPVSELPGLRRHAGTAGSPYVWINDNYVLIPYPSPRTRFAKISYADAYHEDPVLQQVRDRWVLIGVTATGLGESVAIPTGTGSIRLSGVEFTAATLDMLLQDRAITPVSFGFRVTASMALSSLPFLMFWSHRRLRRFPSVVIAILLTLGLTIVMLAAGRTWLPPAAPLIPLLALLVGLLAANMRHWQSMARLDSLTGIANRLRFDQTLAHEWQAHQRSNEPLSLLLIDIDFFKRYNDRYGHAQGDVALVSVAKSLQRTARRPRDLVARYGGEEFVILLADTNGIGAMRVAEAARTNVLALKLAHEGNPDIGLVTVSIGLHTMWPIEAGGHAWSTLIEGADAALYRAKREGRNRVGRYVSRDSGSAHAARTKNDDDNR